MSDKIKLAVFDLDGTITHKDTYLEIVKYDKGIIMSRIAYAYLLWNVLLLKTGKIDNDRLKRNIVARFFKNASAKRLNELGEDFAEEVLPGITYSDALERIAWHKSMGHRVVILTASCDFWLKAWASKLEVDLIATEVCYENDRFTGKLKTPNCYGTEKVTRLRTAYTPTQYEYAFGYGDTPSDQHFMDLMQESYMCHFSII